MKKLLYLFTAISFVFTSCSSDEKSSDDSKQKVLILPKSLTSADHTSDDIFAEIVAYVYDGNKIVSATSTTNGSKTEYIYEGNVIVKEKGSHLDPINGKSTDVYEINYTYVDNKLASSTFIPHAVGPNGVTMKIIKYSYNSDGTVFEEIKTSKGNGLSARDEYEHFICYYKNGNLIKKESEPIVYPNGTVSSNLLYLYEYDSKNNPFKDVLGFNLLLNHEEFSTSNNVINTTIDYGNNIKNYLPVEYVYDSNGYPISSREFLEYEGGQKVLHKMQEIKY